MFEEMQQAPQIDLQQILQEFVQEGGTADIADMVAQLLGQGLESPEAYMQVLQFLAENGVDIEDIPQEYDPNAIQLLIQIFQTIAQQLQQQESPLQKFARGGLASKGRFGDTMLAHINPEEAELLKRYGGSGTINPHTGLPEFGFLKSVGKAFKSVGKAVSSVFKAAAPVLPIAMAFIPGMQGFAATLGSTLGASAAWAPVLGNAIIGGVTGGLTGGSRNILPGAFMGGLGSLASTALGGGTMPWNAGSEAVAGGGAGSLTADTSKYLGGNSSLGSTGAGSFFNQTPTVSPYAAGEGLGSGMKIANANTFGTTGLSNPGMNLAPVSTSVPKIVMPGLQDFANAPLQSLQQTGQYLAQNMKMPAGAQDYMNLGKGTMDLGSAYKNYETSDVQNKMAEEMYNQLLAEGADPTTAQQQVEQYYPSMAFGNMYGSRGSSLYGVA